jgi:hypothetical protein
MFALSYPFILMITTFDMANDKTIIFLSNYGSLSDADKTPSVSKTPTCFPYAVGNKEK